MEKASNPFGEPSLHSDPYPDDPIKVPVAKAEAPKMRETGADLLPSAGEDSKPMAYVHAPDPIRQFPYYLTFENETGDTNWF